MVSKEQRPSWCPSSTPRISKGVPPSARAPSASAAKAKVASGSMNRRISQAQAVRSMCGRGLVTQSTRRPFFTWGEALGLELGNGRAHCGGRRRPTRRSEVLSPALRPKRPLQATELPERVRDHRRFRRVDPPAPPPAAKGRVLNRPGGGPDLLVARIRLDTELLHNLAILLGRQTRGLPHPRRPCLLLDLLGQPLERLPGPGVVREHPNRVVEQDRPQALQAPPDGESKATGIPREPGREENPGGTLHNRKVTAVTSGAMPRSLG